MPIRGVGAPAGGVLGRDAELDRIAAWLAPGSSPGGPRLGVRSRTELAARMPSQGTAAAP